MCLIVQMSLCLDLTREIKTAQSVAQAIKILESTQFDMVISDLGLPDGSGIDIVTWIKAHPDCKNHKTLFVALTAHQDAVTHQKAIGAGFLEVATKPLEEYPKMANLKKYL